MEPTRITLKKLTNFLFGLLLLSACEQDAFFTVPDGNTKLYAFSEISTQDKIKVFVNTAVGINTDDKFIYPKQSDAQVVLLEDGIELTDPGFRYISSEGAFISQGSFRPKAGVEYGLKVVLSDQESIHPILGSTTIPNPDTLQDVKIYSLLETGLPYSKKNFTVNVDVDLKGLDHGLYILRAYFDNKGVDEALIIKEIRQEGVKYSSFKNGILINKDKSGEKINVVFANNEKVDRDLLISNVKLELQSITSDAYNYYKSYSNQVAAQSASIAEPAISYSNFENGLGLFTGYSTTEKLVNIQ